MKQLIFPTIETLILPDDQRIFFKKPLDILLRSSKEIRKVLDEIKSDKSIPFVISVGDITTTVLIEASLIPDLAIVDGYVKRVRSDFSFFHLFNVIEAKNPATYISSEAWLLIKKCLKKAKNKIIIKISGEEDLLVLPTILEAPLNSKVLYGQPNEGLVIVTVTEQIKEKVINLIQRMVKEDEN